MKLLSSLTSLLLSGLLSTAWAEAPADPLNSVMWEYVHEVHLDQAPVVFDSKVEVHLPASAEDSMQVPVSARWNGSERVEEIRLIADLNPIIRVLSYEPVKARPSIAVRFKVQQGTIVRAAMRTTDGVWHVNGAYIDAAGGGCTTPSASQMMASWEDHYGELHAQVWPGEGNTDRLRFQMMHPMDTGLSDGIPKFIIETVEVHDASTEELLGRLTLHEPVAENPMITLDPQHAVEGYRVSFRDNNGLHVSGVIESHSQIPELLAGQFPMQ